MLPTRSRSQRGERVGTYGERVNGQYYTTSSSLTVAALMSIKNSASGMIIIVNMSGRVWARKTSRNRWFLHLHSSDSRGQSFSSESWALLVNAESQEGNGNFRETLHKGPI